MMTSFYHVLLRVQTLCSYTHCDIRVAGVNVGMPYTAVRLVHFPNIIRTCSGITKCLNLSFIPAK